jgi:hypothetical protein
MLRLAVLPLLLLPSACLVKMEVADDVYSPCHAVASTGWTAHVERRQTAHGRPILKRWLIVEGKVTVPGEGYEVSLAVGPVERLREPVRQILVRTEPPGGAAAGGPVTHDVRASFPYGRSFRSLRIRCGDGTLATIAVG